MYFTAGLEEAGSGHLYSFEINRAWADIAERNIRSVSNRFTLTHGAFEDYVTEVLTAPIDMVRIRPCSCFRGNVLAYECDQCVDGS